MCIEVCGSVLSSAHHDLYVTYLNRTYERSDTTAAIYLYGSPTCMGGLMAASRIHAGN